MIERLLDHRDQWVQESAPVTTPLPHLTPDEAALYQDLVEDVLGTGVRLEQERVSFVSLERALHAGPVGVTRRYG